MPDPFKDAKNIDELAKVSLEMFQTSLHTYQTITTSYWKMFAGEVPVDNQTLVENAQTLAGTMAGDLARLQGAFQAALGLSAGKPAGEDDSGATKKGGDGGG